MLALALLVCACRTRKPPAPQSPDPAFSPSQAQLADDAADAEKPDGGATALLPLFDDRSDHPWNRVHHALFQHAYEVQRSACLLKRDLSCDRLPQPAAAMTDLKAGPSDYRDVSSLLVSKDVRFLSSPGRYRQALAALRDASLVPPETNPLAAALLQHDLWERFDTLDEVLRNSQAELIGSGKDPLLILRDQIAALMHRLALPRSVLAKLPSNLSALVSTYPDLLDGLADTASGKWQEVATLSRDRPMPLDSPVREGTRHAQMAGYRAAFRRFAYIPGSAGGAEWLREALREHPPALSLPVGSRLAIFQVPLVVSAEVEIVPLSVITLLESRIVKPAESDSRQLRSLGFEVLEARRPWLRAEGYKHGGLVRLPYDAPFPLGGSCAPNPTTLLPMRSTCVLCHGVAGERLTGTLSHGSQELRISEDADLQVRATIAAKSTRPDFAALRALFKVAL